MRRKRREANRVIHDADGIRPRCLDSFRGPSAECVVPENGVHAGHLVDDLRDTQVDDDRGKGQRVVTVDAVLALHEVEHAGEASVRSSRMSSVTCASTGHSIAHPLTSPSPWAA